MKDAKLKTLIFDLGNVIINLKNDKLWWEDDFGKLFHRDAVEQLKSEKFFHDYEMGKFDDNLFVERLAKHLLPSFHKEQIAPAWNALLEEIPAKRWEDLKRLKSQFRILLLSNTNEIHLQHILSRFPENYFESHFDHCYYSHRMGLAKPDPEIYRHVLRNESILAEEALFFDDKPENTDAANQLGIQTITVKPGVDFTTYFPIEA